MTCREKKALSVRILAKLPELMVCTYNRFGTGTVVPVCIINSVSDPNNDCIGIEAGRLILRKRNMKIFMYLELS